MSKHSAFTPGVPRRLVLVLIAIGAACLVFAPWWSGAVELFGLSRPGLTEGEYWRIVSHHFVHVSWAHMALNLAALALLAVLFATELDAPVWLWVGPLLLVLLSAALLALAPARLYIGLSGALHAMYVVCACMAWRRDRLLAGSVLALILIKVAGEQLLGPAEEMARLVGSPIAVEAHLYGLILGLAAGVGVSAGPFERARSERR